MLKKHSECVVIKDKTQPFASDPQRLFQQSKRNHHQHWAIKKTFFFFLLSLEEPGSATKPLLAPCNLLTFSWPSLLHFQAAVHGFGAGRLPPAIVWLFGLSSLAGASASTWAYSGTTGNVEAWSSCAEQNSTALEHHPHPLVFALHPLCSWDTTRRRAQSIFLHTTLSGLVSPFSPGN